MRPASQLRPVLGKTRAERRRNPDLRCVTDIHPLTHRRPHANLRVVFLISSDLLRTANISKSYDIDVIDSVNSSQSRNSSFLRIDPFFQFGRVASRETFHGRIKRMSYADPLPHRPGTTTYIGYRIEQRAQYDLFCCSPKFYPAN